MRSKRSETVKSEPDDFEFSVNILEPSITLSTSFEDHLSEQEPSCFDIPIKSQGHTEFDDTGPLNNSLVQCRDLLFSCDFMSASSSEPQTQVARPLRRFACSECDEFSSNYKRELDNHMRTHTGERPFACKLCPYTCTSSSLLRAHRKVHTEKKHRCSDCDFRSHTRCLLDDHILTHSVAHPFVCDVCSFSCVTRRSLHAHKKNHDAEKKYKCNVCDYKTHLKQPFNDHMSKHSEDRPYACDLCPHRCINKARLASHKKSHVKERKHKCGQCDYSSHAKIGLDNHMRTHSGERPYACDVCQYTSGAKGLLRQHMFSHSQEKRFNCMECGFGTNVKGRLVNHVRSHSVPKKMASRRGLIRGRGKGRKRKDSEEIWI